MLTNEHVVPYNLWILRKFKCRVNLESCGTVLAVKYIYKYVYKGTTRAAIQIKIVDGKETEVIDEIKQYLDTRFVCSPEAMYHLYGFPMSNRSVTVVQMSIHLPGEQNDVSTRRRSSSCHQCSIEEHTTHSVV
ncbi:unnamed protein product [Caenorhabditis nigoni]